jgi:hypothetical protein
MITEDYVSFETAKLLKEKGFCNIGTMLYKENGDIVRYNVPLNNKGFSSTLGVFYEAPTLQMAMKWLREIHNLEIYPSHDNFQEHHNWWFGIYKVFKGYSDFVYESDSIYPTHEKACEAAIKYCLGNLI